MNQKTAAVPPRVCPQYRTALESLSFSRSVRKFSPPSRGPPVIVFEDTTEPFSALDYTVYVAVVDQLLDQLVVEPPMIAYQVVVTGWDLRG